MAVIGLSTLYLLEAKQPFEDILKAITMDRAKGEMPDFWEIVDNGEHSLDTARLKHLAELSAQGYHFTVHSPYSDVNIAFIDTERRRESLRRVKSAIDSAAEIDALGLVLHPGKKPENAEHLSTAYRLNTDSITSIYEYAKARGVTVAVENMVCDSKSFLSTPTEFRSFFETSGLDILMAFDGAHAQISGLVKPFIEELSTRFYIIHSHDNNGAWDEHLAIGRGRVDWRYITSELTRMGFRGLYVVESIKEPFQSLAYLRRTAEPWSG